MLISVRKCSRPSSVTRGISIPLHLPAVSWKGLVRAVPIQLITEFLFPLALQLIVVDRLLAYAEQPAGRGLNQAVSFQWDADLHYCWD